MDDLKPVDVLDDAPGDTAGEQEPPERWAPEQRVPIDDPEHPEQSVQSWVSWAIVVLCALLVLISLNPFQILRDTTATGGDMGAHVWGPRFLMDELLPSLRVTGWTQDWYAGFPAYVFYMVVPSLLIVWLAAGSGMWDGSLIGIVVGLALRAALLAGVVLGTRALLAKVGDRWFRPAVWVGAVIAAGLLLPVPYNVAFKLITISGLVTLPIAVFVFARAARAPFPAPPLAAVASLFFIYDKGFTILGGNGASTMAGEFAFSISLTLAFFYLAVVFRGVHTGRARALGAVLWGLTILCHLIPAIFAFIVTVVLLFVRREDRTPWWDANAVGRVVAGLLVAGTLLLLVPGDRVPLVGGLVDDAFPQWAFPLVATLVAIVLFTGFQPVPLDWVRDPARRPAAFGIGLIGAGAAVIAMVVLGAPGWSYLAFAAVAVLVLFAGVDQRLLRWAVFVGPVGFLLAAFWFVPFFGNSTYMNDMGWEKYTRYTDYLLADPSLDSGGMPYRNLVFALAGLGVLLALVHRVRLGYYLALTVVAFAWIFRYFPQYRLWNARLLPFYYLALYLLAALAVALVVRSVAIALQELWNRREEPALVGAFGAAVVTLAAFVVLAGSMGWLPGGQQMADPDNSARTINRWGPFDFETTIVHSWASWNYEGLEAKPAYPEFEGMVDMMSAVGDEHGCGRAMWEYESDLQRFGTPMAPMLLPYFTDGCIGSMEGLYFESSSTTPFHFLNQAELSTAPSSAQRDLPYSGFDIDKGISHLQLMGVKYYMATTDQAIAAARGEDRLTEVATETFTYTDEAGTPVENTWAVFEVADADIVTPLANEPVVLSDADDHIDGWVYEADPPETAEGEPRQPKAPGPAVLWYNDPSRWDVFLATSGPDSWARVPSTDTDPPVQTNADVQVSEVDIESDSVSFRVDEVGVPVLVRVSYFPNWSVDGAEGPYRVSPNFMVVVPTEQEVTLSYGRTALDWLGWLLTALGAVAVAGLAVQDHRRRREAAAAAGTTAAEAGAGAPVPDASTADDGTADGSAAVGSTVDASAGTTAGAEVGRPADPAPPPT